MGGGRLRQFVLYLAGLSLLALLLAACGGEEGPASAPTGIAEIDAVIDAVERQDMEALLGFVRFQRVACRPGTEDDYILPPNCPEGKPQGTVVEVFMTGACHPRWVRPAAVPDALQWVSDSRLDTYAVFPSEQPLETIDADYRVVLGYPGEPDRSLSAQMGIADGGLVWLTGWCGSVPQQVASLRDTGAEPIFLATEGLSSPIASPTRPETAQPISSSSDLPAIISDFLLIEGSEHFPAIPPCTAFQAEDVEDAPSPLTISVLPEGAVEMRSIVAFCPDGTILVAVKSYEFADDPGVQLTIFYSRAPYSFPIALADPATQRIEEIKINGQRGLLLVQEGMPTYYRIPVLRFWVDEQDFQDAGAYVQISWNLDAPDIAVRFIEIAESVTVDDPTDSSP